MEALHNSGELAPGEKLHEITLFSFRDSAHKRCRDLPGAHKTPTESAICLSDKARHRCFREMNYTALGGAGVSLVAFENEDILGLACRPTNLKQSGKEELLAPETAAEWESLTRRLSGIITCAREISTRTSTEKVRLLCGSPQQTTLDSQLKGNSKNDVETINQESAGHICAGVYCVCIKSKGY